MNCTEQAIYNLAEAFCSMESHDKATYILGMQSLVNFALMEHIARPIREAQADLDRVAMIREASKHGR